VYAVRRDSRSESVDGQERLVESKNIAGSSFIKENNCCWIKLLPCGQQLLLNSNKNRDPIRNKDILIAKPDISLYARIFYRRN